VGVLDDDLRAACLAALEISPQACLAFAAEHTWEASARAFVDLMALLPPVDPEGEMEPFSAERPQFVA